MEERKTIYLCLAHMSEEGWEQKYVKEAFDTNWVVPMGPNVNAFEQDLQNFVNHNTDGSELDRKVVCLSAGTAAVHLALIGCGVKAGDEVRFWNRRSWIGRRKQVVIRRRLFRWPCMVCRIGLMRSVPLPINMVFRL